MINLLPPENKEAIKFGKVNLTILQYVILAIAVVIVVLGVLVVGSIKLSKIQANLDQEITSTQRKVTTLKTYQEQAGSISKEVKLVGNILDSEIKFSELIPQIGSVMPSGSVLTQLSLNEDISAPLSLTIKVDSEDTAAVLRTNLEQSDVFSRADIISLTSLQGEEYRYQVSILVEFVGEESSAEEAAS